MTFEALPNVDVFLMILYVIFFFAFENFEVVPMVLHDFGSILKQIASFSTSPHRF